MVCVGRGDGGGVVGEESDSGVGCGGDRRVR